MTTSSLTGFGFGCEANSKSLAESLSVRALSTGPKTLLLSFWLFDFFVLARAPFAILEVLVVNWRLGNLSGRSSKLVEAWKSIGRLRNISEIPIEA